MSPVRYQPPSVVAEPEKLVIPKSIMGLDLGQANDYTALTVARPDQAEPPTYHVGHIERIPLKSRYPDIVRHVAAVAKVLLRPLKNGAVPEVTLVVDYTGVGKPVLDMFWEAQSGGLIDQDCNIVAVTITGGERVTQADGAVRVPKRDLVSVIQRVLQEERMRIPEQHPMAPVLTGELTGFRAVINANGHVSYGAGEDWRSAAHDDLVLSLALAIWFGEVTSEGGI